MSPVTVGAPELPEVENSADRGPVLVRIEYRVPPENHAAFREAMQRLGRSRRRTGAQQWGLFEDPTDPDRFVEHYLVGSWEEHMRQHYERLTKMDLAIEQRALDLTANGAEPKVEHLLFAYET
jgi:quinol monooxygenase YgiN